MEQCSLIQPVMQQWLQGVSCPFPEQPFVLIMVTHTVRWFGVKVRVCASGQPELQHCRRTNLVSEIMKMGAAL